MSIDYTKITRYNTICLIKGIGLYGSGRFTYFKFCSFVVKPSVTHLFFVAV